VTWIETVPVDAAEGAVAAAYAAALRRAGRVFGIVRLMSPNPALLAASMQAYGAIMKGGSALSRRRRELLATVTSRHNDCHY
jgi:alkylhydroperoxidase family enzyme